MRPYLKNSEQTHTHTHTHTHICKSTHKKQQQT
jgi:hypothetical protein